MKRHSSALIEIPAAAALSIEIGIGRNEQKSMSANNATIESLAVRFAWVFASAVVLLMVVSLLLAVAGYAGSTFDRASQPKPIPSAGMK